MIHLLKILIIVASSNISAVEIVMNHHVPKEKMTLELAWAVFSGQIEYWSDGTPAKVFVLNDDNPIHKTFTKELLETFPYQLRRAWDRRTFSGTGDAPKQVDSLEDMYMEVVSTPGGIGYLPDKWDGDSLRTTKVIHPK